MSAGISITTLGDLTFKQNNRSISNFPARKAEALLIYLAVERGTAHRRESLFTLLWPGMPEKSARHNLRQVLYALRQTFGEVTTTEGDETVPLLLADRHTVQFNPAAAVEVDTQQLDQLWQSSQVHDHLYLGSCERCIQALEQIIDLYRGDFLADFYLEDSNLFEDWVAANRAAYRQKFLEALEKLTDICIQKGDFEQARAYAEQQIKVDPVRELAYRQLMELLSKSGQRAEALRVYQRCSRVLEIELGTHPSRATTALFEIIRGEDLQKSAAPLQEGTLRGFEIREHLGSGHTGAVYKAYQPVIGRDVALKVILPQFANHPDFIRRFEVEAQLVARLEHPHIVPLYDYWRDPSGAYLVMRWLKAGSLQTALELGPWKPAKAVQLIEQISSALALAHHQGVVHCDIKPANILLDEGGNAYLTDFGIAILTGPLVQLTPEAHADPADSSTGSLGYTSPETARGLDTTPRADIYSLGVVLFELLCGVHPFPGLEGEALVQKHLTEALPSVAAFRPELPEAVDAVIQKATQKDPAQRYPDVESLTQDFKLALTPERVTPPEISTLPLVSRNPYKGLRPFAEADAVDFFGRDELVARLVARLSPDKELDEPARFLAVVGPSGSGKSSAVQAGLIPAIRRGAIPGSERWFVAEMTPGAHPLEELETALLRISMQTPDDLLTQLSTDPRGFIKVLRRALPEKESQVLLVVDQFEETFTLVENAAERNHFMTMLAAAIQEKHSPLHLVITLRADFYDRPLQHSEFGQLVREATEVVLPLTPEELERAICGPAEIVGASLEPGLVTRIVQEVGEQPGALPLLQYALTETFDQREDHQLTLAAYEASGGVLGALGRRAEEIYHRLDETEQALTRQLFLRLVTLGEGTEDVRRRVLRSEIAAMTEAQIQKTEEGYPTAALDPVIDGYGRHRLLTFDHDPATRAPTIEVAHEALLREWPRLRHWLDESRDDIRLQRMLGGATQEWLASGKEPGYLLREARLDQFALWAEDTSLALTADEQAYLAASLEKRREREAAETARQAQEEQLRQRSRRFLQALVGVFALAAVIAAALSLIAFNQSTIAQNNAATATFSQGEALVLADSRATQQAIAEEEADARAIAEAQALADRDRALAAEQEALKQASIGLASLALQEMQTANSERGVLLALAALEEYPYTPQAEAALGRAVQESLPYKLLNDEKGHDLDGHWVDWSPDGKRIAVGRSPNDTGERSAIIFNMETDEIDLVLPLILPIEIDSSTGKFCSVQQINWSPDGSRLALVVNNNNAESPDPSCYYFQIYDAVNGNLILEFDSQGEYAVDWSPDGNTLLTGGKDGRVRLWDAQNGNLISEMEEHTKSDFEIFSDTNDSVLAARFSPDGNLAATFTVGGELAIWNIDGENIVQTFAHPPEIVNSQLAYPGMNKIGLSWSPNGDYLATAWYDGLGRVWDIKNGNVQSILAGHTSNMIGIDWSPDGVYLLTQGIDTSARLWAASTGQPVLNLPAVGYGNVAWSSDSHRMAVPTQKGLLMWDISFLPPIINLNKPNQYRLLETIWSPDGQSLVIAGKDGLVIDWAGHRDSYNISPTEGFIAFSPDSSRLISVDGESLGVPQIIDLDSGKVIMELQNPDPDVMYFTNSWSHDGNLVASGSYPGFWTVFWDPETGEELARSEIIPGFMKQADFSPDDTILASPSIFTDENSPVYLIDTQTGNTIKELPSTHGWSQASYWAPNGKLLAVGHQNGTINLWDTETWTKIKTFEAHLNSVWDLCWSPNGQRIISGDDNGTILVWEVETGNIVMRWDMGGLLQGGFNDTDWSPDGNFVVIHGTGDMPYIKRVWQSTEDLISYAYQCCVWRELTPSEREQFGLPEKP